ncbi:MAG: hypothetical protein LiPW30_693 [Parcubacteria group bacterium LiPW_30]|nr:MAG: hypothetical protein LiPW30_693 [Parcubacteria group bacterium LiPW_30]
MIGIRHELVEMPGKFIGSCFCVDVSEFDAESFVNLNLHPTFSPLPFDTISHPFWASNLIPEPFPSNLVFQHQSASIVKDSLVDCPSFSEYFARLKTETSKEEDIFVFLHTILTIRYICQLLTEILSLTSDKDLGIIYPEYVTIIDVVVDDKHYLYPKLWLWGLQPKKQQAKELGFASFEKAICTEFPFFQQSYELATLNHTSEDPKCSLWGKYQLRYHQNFSQMSTCFPFFLDPRNQNLRQDQPAEIWYYKKKTQQKASDKIVQEASDEIVAALTHYYLPANDYLTDVSMKYHINNKKSSLPFQNAIFDVEKDKVEKIWGDITAQLLIPDLPIDEKKTEITPPPASSVNSFEKLIKKSRRRVLNIFAWIVGWFVAPEATVDDALYIKTLSILQKRKKQLDKIGQVLEQIEDKKNEKNASCLCKLLSQARKIVDMTMPKLLSDRRNDLPVLTWYRAWLAILYRARLAILFAMSLIVLLSYPPISLGFLVVYVVASIRVSLRDLTNKPLWITNITACWCLGLIFFYKSQILYGGWFAICLIVYPLVMIIVYFDMIGKLYDWWS